MLSCCARFLSLPSSTWSYEKDLKSNQNWIKLAYTHKEKERDSEIHSFRFILSWISLFYGHKQRKVTVIEKKKFNLLFSRALFPFSSLKKRHFFYRIRLKNINEICETRIKWKQNKKEKSQESVYTYIFLLLLNLLRIKRIKFFLLEYPMIDVTLLFCFIYFFSSRFYFNIFKGLKERWK